MGLSDLLNFIRHMKIFIIMTCGCESGFAITWKMLGLGQMV